MKRIYFFTPYQKKQTSRPLVRQSAFTLVELLIVISIVGILAMVAMPSFNEQIKRDRLSTSANQLHSAYKFARSEAVKLKEPIDLVVAGDNWEIRLASDDPDDLGDLLRTFIPKNPTDITITGLANLRLSSTGNITTAVNTATGVTILTVSYNATSSATPDYRICILVSGQSTLTDDLASETCT
jgi:type IV fimbrial biogenesis protein FimT